MRKISFTLLMILLMAGFCSYAAENSAVSGRPLVIDYLEFREVDIKDVLRQLARQYDLNIVFSESVRGYITVQLQDVTIEEVLDAIITINGFVYTTKDNVIKVTTPAEAEQEGKRVKVFRLRNASAPQLAQSLSKVLSSDGSVQVDERSNSLIVTDIPRVINEINRMLREDLDNITRQVMIEAKFIETTLGATESLGIDWNMQATATGSERPTTVPFRAATNNPNYKNMFPAGDPADGLMGTSFGFPYITADAEEFTMGTLDFTAYTAVLKMIKTRSDSRLISSPRIVTMDNAQAEIYIGKARPIPQFTMNDDTGAYQITDFEEKIEGVVLTVTPQISEVDSVYYIRLKLKPRVTSYFDKVSFTGLGFDYPVLSERYADTEVIIKNGQTIVIGGLIETKKTETIRKVPFLSDIPFLGKAFTYRSTDPDSKTELLIFITARIVKDDETSPVAIESNLITDAPRPFKLKLREDKEQ